MTRKLILLTAGLYFLSLSSLSAATTYKYDDLGRLTCVAYDNGKVIVYHYDPAGNRTQVIVQGTACP